MKSNPIRAEVLCVDDDEALLLLLETALTNNGYGVLTASNGREALTLLSEHRFDAIVLDYAMPGMSGGEVALEVKHTWPEVPIVLFSGSYDTPTDTLAQVNAFVPKGEGLRPLLAVLARLLQVPEKLQPAVRKFPRFPARLSLAVTIHRAGQLAMLQGVATDLGEGGVGGIIDGDLEPGEYVLLRISDSLKTQLEPRAQVRYRKNYSYGFEFSNVGPIEQADVRQLCGRLASE